MAPLFLDPGLLRRRAVLEAPVEISDGAGGAATAWQELRELSVHVEPTGVEARERFDRREVTVTHRVICRTVSGLERGQSFRLGERRLIIRSVHDPDETGRFLICRCEEEA
ncbi:phage head closure protein [Aurantimonas sp. VKM B-3413]|uniref:phage head closure protein n=1 Tax=Aurantimonas sp. VKM B-3413 TaxID=2779401 RepID=UPI001E4AF6F0|nr:phage head closure protein [Aurantimonas sp. VKM B-3413]MCB8836100.1 phage head closure protein [Aurantimonas sp. VKM B-3413]